MQSTTYTTLTLLSILLFCSCSNPGDTAQIPEMAPVHEMASKDENDALKTPFQDANPRPKKDLQPAEVMLQQNLFRSTKQQFSDDSFAADSFLETQTSFDQLGTAVVPTPDQADFSQDLILGAE